MESILKKVQTNLFDLTVRDVGREKHPNKTRSEIDFLRLSFLKFNKILRKIDEICEKLIEKRRKKLVESLIEGLIVRLVEIGEELFLGEENEFFYFEDLVLDEKENLVSN